MLEVCSLKLHYILNMKKRPDTTRNLCLSSTSMDKKQENYNLN